jgi:hypothetical protein
MVRKFPSASMAASFQPPFTPARSSPQWIVFTTMPRSIAAFTDFL